MYKLNKRGQSTVEYVLLVAAVIAVLIVFTTGQNSTFQGQLNSTLNGATSSMNTASGKITEIVPTGVPPGGTPNGVYNVTQGQIGNLNVP